MFFKQSGYKPRTSSASSGTSETSNSVAGSPPKDETKGSNGSAGNRRRSIGADKFAGLEAMKRGSQDQQRRTSWADQTPGQPGILGGMWQSFTKGANK